MERTISEKDALRERLHELEERLDAIERGHAAGGDEAEARWREVHDSLQETIRLLEQAEQGTGQLEQTVGKAEAWTDAVHAQLAVAREKAVAQRHEAAQLQQALLQQLQQAGDTTRRRGL